jgi:hypothetical protein
VSNKFHEISSFDSLNEMHEIAEDILLMKDKTLDYFHEDKKLATQLMLDLNALEKKAQSLIKQFEQLV